MLRIAFVVGMAVCAVPATVCAKPVKSRTIAAVVNVRAAQFLATNARRPGVETTASGLQFTVIAPGSGDRPGQDEIATVDYTGALPSGAVFASGAQVDLYVAAQVPGLSEGLKLMPLQSHYRFWVPPAIGYGMRLKRGVPAGSVLVYDVMLRDFRNKASDGPQQE